MVWLVVASVVGYLKAVVWYDALAAIDVPLTVGLMGLGTVQARILSLKYRLLFEMMCQAVPSVFSLVILMMAGQK